MKTKVIVLSDIHYVVEGNAADPGRRGDYGDILLLRAVHRINRFLKPDLVILGGDLIDDKDPLALEKIKKITDLLTMPVLAIPGNHDCSVDDFFRIFPENPDFLDIRGCRFIPFYDEEMPGYNAKRSQDDLTRMKALAQNFSGPVVACQHVPLFQPGTSTCPYNYTNIDTTIGDMKSSGVTVAVSGHHHEGFFSEEQSFGTSVCVPALCQKPFLFWELSIDEDSHVTCTEHSLAMPEELQLFDVHVHSNFAYCNENMDFQKAVELAGMFNLNKLSFSEHSSHLYFSRENYCNNNAFKNEFPPVDKRDIRFDSFIDSATPFKSEQVMVGLEVDCNFKGEPMICHEHIDIPDLKLGAIHALPEQALASSEQAATCFKGMMEKFTDFPMDILAHPLRVFRRSNLDVPEELFPFLVKLLKKKKIAAEINYHTNDPSEKFFSMCIEEGVKLAFGSDSHNLYEVGEFYPHLNFLKKLGCDKDIKILF